MILTHRRWQPFRDFRYLFSTDFDKLPQHREQNLQLINNRATSFEIALRDLKEEIMPRNSSTKKAFKFAGYSNITIPSNLKTKVKEFCNSRDEVFNSMTQALSDGYSFKAYFDKDKAHYRASLTCMNSDDVNFGYVLSAFAGDWQTALAVVLYKHFYVAMEQWDIVQEGDEQAFG